MNMPAALVLGISVLLGLTSLGYVAGNSALKVKGLERTVTVKGLSEREVAANIAAWPVSFQVATNDLDELYASVEQQSEIIRQFLHNSGISADDIIPSPLAVVDLFAQTWGDKSNIKFRYTADASLTVYTENVAAVRDAMANLVALGKQGVAVRVQPQHSPANRIFLFTRLSEIKPEMVEQATISARAVAEKFAADSNSKLGKIKTARQGQFSIADRDATTPHIKKVRVVSTIEYYLSD